MSHIPDRAAVLADKLVVNMKEERRANPILPPGLYMNKKPQNLVCHIIRSDQEQGTPEGSSWWDSRWVSHCGCWTSTSIPGGENSLPLSFQVAWPQQILSTLPGVDSGLVLDSLNLPENWKDIGPRSLLHWGRNLLWSGVEASEDLVTGGPTYHLLDVIKLAFIYLISCISHILALIFLVSWTEELIKINWLKFLKTFETFWTFSNQAWSQKCSGQWYFSLTWSRDFLANVLESWNVAVRKRNKD